MSTLSTSWLEHLTQSISAANISISVGPYRPSEAQNALSEVVNAPIQWGFITGFVLSTYLHYLARHLKWMRKVQGALEACARQVKYSLKLFGSLAMAIVMIPLVILPIMGAFAAYRKCLETWLRKCHGDRFCGLLEGHDANWVLEDEKCKSVINVLGSFEGGEGSAKILMALRKRLASRLLGKHQPHPKLFYRRQITGGFAFWYKVFSSEIFIEDFVRLVDIESENEDFLTEEELKAWIGKMYNADLPKGHTTSWEILVSNKPLVKDDDGERVNPVLFRVHHSLGDGIALIRFVLDTIADKKSSTADLWQKGQRIIMNRKIMTILRNARDQYIPTSSRRPSLRVQINLSGFKDKVFKAVSLFRMSYQCPLVLNEQLILRPVDDNSLHHAKNADLSEDKFVNWHLESDPELFYKLKAIKSTVPGVRFSDVLLTALSTSLYQHFSRKVAKHAIPKQITLVIPMRMGPLSQKLELNNRFSVGLQTLPISPPVCGFSSTREVVVANILRTHKKSQELLNRFDLLINFWILGSASSIIPLPILGPMVRSKHCTMVLSNLPGPKDTVSIGEAQLKDLTFWLPNRGSTGLGITVITYRDRIQMGIGGDKTVLDDDQQESQRLMGGIIREVNKMYEICCS